MKCMASVDKNTSKELLTKNASQLYEEGWNYVSKSLWKEKVRDVEKPKEEKPTKTKSNKISKAQKRHLRKS